MYRTVWKKIGFRGKAVVVLGGLILISLISLGATYYYYGSALAIEKILKLTTDEIAHDSQTVLQGVADGKSDLSVVLDTPPVQGILRALDNGGIDPKTNDRTELWYGRLEQIFASFLRGHSDEYIQLRYVDAKGKELVRADLIEKQVRITPRNKLLERAQNAYVSETLRLKKGEYYYSDISLYREQGRIAVPYEPVFRISTPVYDDADKLRGLIILKISARTLFPTVIASTKGIHKSVVNQNGYFLIHPDRSKELGFDLGSDYTLTKEQPDLAEEMKNAEFHVKHHREDRHVDGFKKIFFDPADRNRFWAVVYTVPDAIALADVHTMQNRMLIIGSLIALLSINFILWLSSRWVIDPLTRIIEAATKMDAGDLSVRLDVNEGSHQFFLLSRLLNSFAEKQQNSIENYRNELALRTDELTTANARMNEYFESTTQGIYSVDLEGRCTFVNKAGMARLGYTLEELLGKNMHTTIHHSKPDRSPYPQEECPIFRAAITGVAARADNEWLWCKDGSILAVEYVSYPITVAGVIKGNVVTFSDISEKIRIEQQMKKLSSAVEQSLAAVFITDVHGTIEYVNPAFEARTGYRSAEAIGKSPSILKSGRHSREFYRELWDKLLNGNVWHGELINKKKNGAIFYEDAVITPVKGANNEITHFTAIKTDITERKLAEMEVERKNRELELRMRHESTHSKIMELFSSSYNEQEIFKKMLATLARELNYPVSAIYLHDEWTGTLHCASKHGASGSIRNDMNLGEGIIGQAAAEKRSYIIEGSAAGDILDIDVGLASLKPAAIIASPIVYQEKLAGVLVLASTQKLTDVEKVFVERLSGQTGVALNTLHQYINLKELSSQLKLKQDEISIKNALLEHTNQLKSEFLANMSHELRTPLNAIIGFSEVLKDGMLGDMTHDQQSYMTDIFSSGQHLLSLINDILDLSKIEAGKMTLDLESVYLPHTLQNSLSVVKEKALAGRIKLTLEISADLGEAYVDPRKFKQILYNLLSNAVKFTPDGGSVSVQARRVGDMLEISVTDTGIGISSEGLKQLFMAFVQLDGSTSRKFEGTGLGLVMVKRLAELHGGSVTVTSEPGKGSCFTVIIPYREDPGEEAGVALVQHVKTVHSPPVAATAGVSGKPLVLIIEDDDPVAELYRLQLKGAGYRTVWAHNGKVGLEMAASERPDLITLDILMPEMDGWEFLSHIQKNVELCHIPIVIVSIVSELNRGIALGASKVLQKPVSNTELIAALEDLNYMTDGSGMGRTVLVVDDDPKSVDFVARHLEKRGFEVHRAYGGQQAIEMAAQDIPELVILDLMMPEVSGFDVVEALRGDLRTVAIPIIVLTAKVLTTEEMKGLQGNVLNIIKKESFRPDNFLCEVQRALRGGRK